MILVRGFAAVMQGEKQARLVKYGLLHLQGTKINSLLKPPERNAQIVAIQYFS